MSQFRPPQPDQWSQPEPEQPNQPPPTRPFIQQLQPPEQPSYTQPEKYYPPPPRLHQSTQPQQRKPSPQIIEQQNKQDVTSIGLVLFILGVFLFVGVIYGVTRGNASNQPTVSTTDQTTPIDQSTPISQPTTAPQNWTTTHTFTGNGSEKTALFIVSDTWRVLWSCNFASYGSPYNVIIDIGTIGNNTLETNAINSTCQSDNTSGSGYIYQGGQIYLDITSESFWKITIQEPH